MGMGAIAMNIFMLALGLVLFLGSLADVIGAWRTKRRGMFDKRDSRISALFGSAIALMFVLAGSNLFVHEIHLHSDLVHLRPESVERIAIGSHVVTDHQHVHEIVGILRRPQWFNISRGDRGDTEPFVIRFKDGGSREYVAMNYQQGVGVVLESISPYGWENGQVLYPELTDTLLRDGITLPPCLTVQGKPVHCAPWTSAASNNR